jgi:hypothetical protein
MTRLSLGQWRQRLGLSRAAVLMSIDYSATRRCVPAPSLRCPAGGLEQAASSNAFLNAIWNAFWKLFISSKAPICCIIATKRSWRSPSVAGLVRNLRINMATPRKQRHRVAL